MLIDPDEGSSALTEVGYEKVSLTMDIFILPLVGLQGKSQGILGFGLTLEHFLGETDKSFKGVHPLC